MPSKAKVWLDPAKDIWADRVWLPLSEMTEQELRRCFSRMERPHAK